MAKKRIKAYWLLLLTLLYTASIVLSVGESQARYVNTVTWDTVVEVSEDQVSSDLLQNTSQPPVKVLLGEMSQEPYQVPITLESGADVAGELAWSVYPENYISVEMSIGNAAIAQDGERNQVQLLAGEPVTVTMKLTPKADAFSTPREAVDISVTVTWGNTLKGTFLAVLPEVEEILSEQPTELPTEPPATEPPATEPPATEPPATEPPVTETEPPATEPPATDPPAAETEPPAEETQPPTTETEAADEETTEPTVNNDANVVSETESSSEDTTAPAEETASTEVVTASTGEVANVISDTAGSTDEDLQQEAEENTDGGTDDNTGDSSGESSDGENSEGSTGENTDGSTNEETNSDATVNPDTPSESVTPIPEEKEPVVIQIDAAESFEITEQLPLQITVPDGATMMQLGMVTENATSDGTDESTELVLRQLPRYLCYSLDYGESYYMLYHADIIELNPNAQQPLSVLLDWTRTELKESELVLAVAGYNGQTLVGTGTTAVNAVTEQQVTMSSRFLTKGQSLTIEIPESWQSYAMSYTLEMLECSWSEDGKTGVMSYTELIPEHNGLKITWDETAGALILEMGDTLPLAGSYRISIYWISEDTCVKQAQETFFINYLAYQDIVETGGAEQ